MKKTIKFFALMAVAGAMVFTGCKKDDEETTETGTTLTVNFNGGNKPVTIFAAVTDNACEYFEMLGYNDVATLSNRTNLVAWGDAAKGSMWSIDEDDFNDDERSYLGFSTNKEYMVEGLDEWLFSEATDFSVNEFDATSLTLTTTMKAEMASYFEYSLGTEPADCSVADIIITAKNLSLTPTDEKMSKVTRKNPFRK